VTTITHITETLGQQFHANVRVTEKRPNVFQVHAPFYHEDGDQLDMFVTPTDAGLRLSDYGMTLMRLSYTFDLDSDNKQRIFKELLLENQVEFDEAKGNIYFDTTPENLCFSLLHFSQVIAKVSRLDVLKRAFTSGLFFEMVNEFISTELKEFNPVPSAQPIPGRDDLEATCSFEIRPKPVYLFAVRGGSHAKVAALSFLEYQRAQLAFKGYVVHDDFEALSAKDRKRITSAADKQFVSLDDFRQHSKDFLRREMAA